MHKLKIEIELIYDDIFHYNDEEKKWFFNEILKKDKLILHSNEIGDEIGQVKVIKIYEQ
jgi:hypothetical protein